MTAEEGNFTNKYESTKNTRLGQPKNMIFGATMTTITQFLIIFDDFDQLV